MIRLVLSLFSVAKQVQIMLKQVLQIEIVEFS